MILPESSFALKKSCTCGRRFKIIPLMKNSDSNESVGNFPTYNCNTSHELMSNWTTWDKCQLKQEKMSTNGMTPGTKEVKYIPASFNGDTTSALHCFIRGHFLGNPIVTCQYIFHSQMRLFLYFPYFSSFFHRSKWSSRRRAIFKEWTKYYQSCISKSKSDTIRLLFQRHTT